MPSPARRLTGHDSSPPASHPVEAGGVSLSLSELARYARFLGLAPVQIARVALHRAIWSRLRALGDDPPNVAERIRLWAGRGYGD